MYKWTFWNQEMDPSSGDHDNHSKVDGNPASSYWDICHVDNFILSQYPQTSLLAFTSLR